MIFCADADWGLRMRFLPILILALIAITGCQRAKHELELKYDTLTIDMTYDQVIAIMGEGKSVSTKEFSLNPEYSNIDTTDLPADIRWVRWHEGYPYVIGGFSKDKLVVVQITGVDGSRK